MQTQIPKFVQFIVAKLQTAGYEVYIVGGVVRDLVINNGQLPSGRKVDWDLTTNATPEVILKIFPEAFYDNKFGTVGLVDPENPEAPVYEITTFRTETKYSDRRHPDEVRWGKSLEEDLQRRDFTMNAMALKASNKIQDTRYNCEIIDLYSGQEDIKKRIIKAVGNPKERFEEDALRMMRAVRLAAQLDFGIEEQTLAAIKEQKTLLDFVSWERIRDELFKILASAKPAEGYQLLRSTGLAGKILPEMEKCFEVEQKSPGRHHIYDVGTHSVEALRASQSTDPLVRLATLIHDVGKSLTYKKLESGTITFYNHEVVGARIAKQIANRLKLSKNDAERLYRLVRWHLFTVDEKQTDKAVRRFIKNVGKENLEDILQLRLADRLGSGAQMTSWRLERFKQQLVEVQKEPFTVQDLKVDGHDVMEELKIHPGPMVGKVLAQIFAEVEDGKLTNEREKLLARIKDIKITLLQ